MLGLSACAETTSRGVGPGGGNMDGGGPPGICTANATQSCTCTDTGGSGTQSCGVEGTWGQCFCSSLGDDDGDGVEQPPVGQRCKAGYYTGTFTGNWRPAILDIGIAQFPVEIDAQETDRGPGLAFNLEEKIVGEDTEFPTYEVKDGCMIGTATIGIGDQHPFVAKLTGELDCETGVFTGNMDGAYSLFGIAEVLGIPGDAIANYYYFTGDFGNMAPEHALVANYETGDRLDQGVWDLREKQSPPESEPGAGGEGTWEAMWAAETAPASLANCQEEMRRVLGEAAGDAGVPPPVFGDAGI